MKMDNLIQATNCPVCKGADYLPLIRVDDERHHTVRNRLIACCGHCSTTYLRERVPLDHLGSCYPPDYISYQFKLIDAPKSLRDRFVNKAILDIQKRRIKTIENFLAKENRLKKASLEELRVLDIGCGTGLFLDYVRRRWGCIVKGYDFSQESVQYARQKFALDVEVKTTKEWQEDPGTYDVITMNHYLEHEYEPGEVVSNAYKKLRDDGILFVDGVPHIKSLSMRIFGRYWYDFDCPRHTIFFERETIKDLLEDVGFSVSHFSFSNEPIAWSGSFQSLIGLDLWGKGGFYRNFFSAGALYLSCYPLSIISNLIGLGDEITIIAKKYRVGDITNGMESESPPQGETIWP